MKEFRSVEFDLRKLRFESPLWDDLLGLTVEGWAAKEEFRLIRRGHYKRGSFKILIVFDGDKPIAWGMRVQWKFDEHPNIWLYTHPEYRNMGIQKNIILPHWNKVKETFTVWGETDVQKKTFKYLDKTIVAI